jgi:hypothetical protein
MCRPGKHCSLELHKGDTGQSTLNNLVESDFFVFFPLPLFMVFGCYSELRNIGRHSIDVDQRTSNQNPTNMKNLFCVLRVQFD